MADERSVAEIEADLAATRQRLTENISQLVYQVHPKAVTHRTVEEGKRRTRQAIADGKAKVRQSVEDGKVKLRQSADWVAGRFHDERGWNVRTIAIVGAVVAVTVVVAAASSGKKK